MAIAELVMPKMGESIMEATILKWHKKVGDHIKLDETVLDIATDKIDSEVPSTAEGTLVEILFNVNDVVPIGTVIARVNTGAGTTANITTQGVQGAPMPPTQYQQEFIPPVHSQSVVPPTHSNLPQEVPYTPQMPPAVELMAKPAANRFYSPLVLNIANSEGISLSELERIPGTGGDGRVSKKDILQYVADKKAGRIPALQPPPSQSVYANPTPPPVQNIGQPSDLEQARPSGNIPARLQAAQLAAQQLAQRNAQQTTQQTSVPANASSHQQVVSNIRDNQPDNQTLSGATQQLQQQSPVQSQPQEQPQPQSQAQQPQPQPQPSYQPQKAEQISPPIQSPSRFDKPVAAEKEQTIAVSSKLSDPGAVIVSGATEIIEMDRMRKLISKHMVDSKQTSPHVTSFAEADVTNMVIWREKVKKEFEQREGTKLTYTPMFIECIAKVIRQFPWVNSSVTGDQIVLKKDINIGMATALPDGNLIVPVVKGADQMNIVGLSKSVNALADAARNGKLKPEDTAGGTFTLTNVGTFGGLMGTPIINQPQVAIMAVGIIKKRPMVIESPEGDTIGIRHMMYLSLSYDHRIVDGSIGASFLTAVAKELEAWDPEKQWFHYL